jgi:K+-sensing histidine kinase KdpD
MDRLQLQALESWMNVSDEGVIVIDASGEIRLINARLLTLFELGKAPQTLHELLHQTRTTIPELRALLSLHRADDLAQWGDVHIHKAPARRLNWEQVALLQRGKVTGSMTVFRDANARGQLEMAKQSFLSMVSHDLRTPLSTILGFAELLYNSQGSLSEEEQREFVQHIIKNANQLSRYSQIALDILFLEANSQNFELEKVFLGNFIKHWLLDARHRFAVGRLAHHNELPEGRMALIAPAALHRILYILAEFALEESPAEEQVDINLNYDQFLAHVLIQHHAPNLKSEDAAVLFQLLHPRDLSETGRPLLHRMQLYVASLLARKQQGFLTLRDHGDHIYQLDLALPLSSVSSVG